MSNIPEDLTTAISYNSHDLGDLGRFIRLTYLYEILEKYEIRKRPQNHWGTIEYPEVQQSESTQS